MTKRIITILITIVLITLSATNAMAVGPIDPAQEIRLDINCQNGGTAIVGAGFSIYHVASVGQNGVLVPTPMVSAYSIDLSDLSDSHLPVIVSTLEGFLLRDNVPPTDHGVTDENGQLQFPSQAEGLEAGLYLVMGSRHEQEGFVYEMQPFLVMLPTLDQVNDVWVYNVVVKPKYTKEELPGGEPEKLKVLKIWEDSGYEDVRPEQIQVQLLCDGEIYDTVTLSKENGWSYTWENLEQGHQWLIVEIAPEGYTVVVNRTGITFTVTNTKEGPPPPPHAPPPPDIPQTGQLNWPIPVLVLAGLLLIMAGVLRRRGCDHEN